MYVVVGYCRKPTNGTPGKLALLYRTLSPLPPDARCPTFAVKRYSCCFVCFTSPNTGCFVISIAHTRCLKTYLMHETDEHTHATFGESIFALNIARQTR